MMARAGYHRRTLGWALLAVLLIISDHYLGYLAGIRSGLSVLVYPLQVVSGKPVEYLEVVAGYLGSRERLLEKNATLQDQLVTMQVRLQRHASLEEENLRLRELLASSIRLEERVQVAQLVSMDVGSGQHHLVVDQGSRHDVYTGQPLVDAGGVMGQVLHVGPFTSTVLLITDARHALPVVLNRTGVRAVAEGTGSLDRLRLRYIGGNVDVREGELVVSSGLGGKFPQGYPVARVSRVKRNPGGEFIEVEATPVARMERSRKFLLVWHNGHPAADRAGSGQGG